MSIFKNMTGSRMKGFDRLDWSPGRYLARIDSVKVEESRDNRSYVKIRSTVLKVLENEGDGALPVGAEPAQALFPDSFGFFESDMKKLFRAALDLSREEADGLDGPATDRILEGGLTEGRVVDVSVFMKTVHSKRQGKDVEVMEITYSPAPWATVVETLGKAGVKKWSLTKP